MQAAIAGWRRCDRWRLGGHGTSAGRSSLRTARHARSGPRDGRTLQVAVESKPTPRSAHGNAAYLTAHDRALFDMLDVVDVGSALERRADDALAAEGSTEDVAPPELGKPFLVAAGIEVPVPIRKDFPLGDGKLVVGLVRTGSEPLDWHDLKWPLGVLSRG